MPRIFGGVSGGGGSVGIYTEELEGPQSFPVTITHNLGTEDVVVSLRRTDNSTFNDAAAVGDYGNGLLWNVVSANAVELTSDIPTNYGVVDAGKSMFVTVLG